MFCPKCGKTVQLDAKACPFCGLPAGESRFEGSNYTATQAYIRPGDNVSKMLSRTYVRDAYTAHDDRGFAYDDQAETYYESDDHDSDAQDFHAEAESANAEDVSFDFDQQDAAQPEDTYADFDQQPAEEQNESAEASEVDDYSIEVIDKSEICARPIELTAQAGISPELARRMQAYDTQKPRRLRGFGRRKVYDDFNTEEDVQEQSFADGQPVEDVPYPSEDTHPAENISHPAEDVYPAEDVGDAAPEQFEDGSNIDDIDDEQLEVFDDIDAEEFEEIRNSEFGFKQILKIVIAVIIVAALAVAGVLWMNYIRDNQSTAPIENVRETLYNEGISLIESHASAESVDQIIRNYSSGGNLASLQSQLTTLAATVTGLSPEDVTESEKIFVQALLKIESNITNCIISDAIAVGSNDANAAAESDERWKIVNNAITMLKAASSTAELTAIINGEVVDIQQQDPEVTPTPEPAVNYNTLSKGDKSDEVVEMQTRLVELGYLKESPDGAFGNNTQTAVKIFQQVTGLPVTGIADNMTLTALYAEDAPAANASN